MDEKSPKSKFKNLTFSGMSKSATIKKHVHMDIFTLTVTICGIAKMSMDTLFIVSFFKVVPDRMGTLYS